MTQEVKKIQTDLATFPLLSMVMLLWGNMEGTKSGLSLPW